MKNKKFLMIPLISILSIALALVTLLTPMVHIVGHAADAEKTIVYDNTVNLIQYAKDLPFLNTDAFDVYFNASGPMWLAVTGILLNYLIIVGAMVLLFSSVAESFFINTENIAIKNNNLTKKVALFVGIFTLLVVVFEITAFIVTTMLSNNYGEFYPQIQNYIVAVISILIIIFASLIGKKEGTQPKNKAKDAIGFALTGIFTLLCAGVPFLPIYTPALINPGFNSMYALTANTNLFAGELSAGGDYPIGMTFYVICAIGFVCAFVFIYSLIGFILTLCNKKTNWLSARIKRWSTILLVVYTILLALVVASVSVLASSINIDKYFVFTPLIFLVIFANFLPYITSSMVSLSKKEKHE